MLKLIAGCALAAVAMPADAQDVPSPYESAVTDHAQIQLDSTLAKRRLQQARERQRRRGAAVTPVGPRARAVCLDKRRLASRLPAVKARQLYALCAQAGL